MGDWTYVWNDEAEGFIVSHWNGSCWEYVSTFRTEDELYDFFYSVGVFRSLDDLGVYCDG